jgi:predicted phage terminase large subunit-like protein
VINLPAIAEENDPLGRMPGEALCPERYDLEALERKRREYGTYKFEALYQQRPLPAAGALFQETWFDVVDSAPANASRVRYWDKAATEGGGSYSCGVLMARSPEGVFFVEDVVRGQWSSGKRELIMLQTAKRDRERYGQVDIVVEKEGGSGGKDSVEWTTKNLAGFPVRFEPVRGSKESRAQPFSAQCEFGNVKLVHGRWNRDYLDELTLFPFGTHDDQVDASTGAFREKVSNFPDYVEKQVNKGKKKDKKSVLRLFDEAMARDLNEWDEGSDYDDDRRRFGW